MNVCHLRNPTADECASSRESKSTPKHGVHPMVEVEIRKAKFGLWLELWTHELIGKPDINFYFGSAGPFWKARLCCSAWTNSMSTLRCTGQHCNAVGDRYAIALPSLYQRWAFLIEKTAVNAQFAMNRAGSNGAVDLASLNTLFLWVK